jgi:hypothetical protein
MFFMGEEVSVPQAGGVFSQQTTNRNAQKSGQKQHFLFAGGVSSALMRPRGTKRRT